MSVIAQCGRQTKNRRFIVFDRNNFRIQKTSRIKKQRKLEKTYFNHYN